MSKRKNKPIGDELETEADLDHVPGDDEVATQPLGRDLVPTVEPRDGGPQHIRPSELAKLIETHAAENNVKPESIDPFRFVREQGLPNPTRKYRVYALRAGNASRPVDIEHATDESDATSQAIAILKIQQPHRFTFRHAILEQ